MNRNMASWTLVVALGAFACIVQAADIPSKYLGTYQSDSESETNFGEFKQPFLKNGSSLFNAEIVAFRREGDDYYQTFVQGSTVSPYEVKFHIGEPFTMESNGKTFQVEHNIQTNSDGKTVLNTKGRDESQVLAFTVETTFSDDGISVVLRRGDVTAKKRYFRIPNPKLGGLFEAVPSSASPNLISMLNRTFPVTASSVPGWSPNTVAWLGRHGPDAKAQYFMAPGVSILFRFRLGQKRTIKWNRKPINYTYTLVEEDSSKPSITLRGEFVTEAGTLIVESAVDMDGINSTYRLGNEVATRYYKRVVPYIAYGTYETVPNDDEHWRAFLKSSGWYDDFNQKTRLSLYKKDEATYLRVVYPGNGPKHLVKFDKINQTTEIKVPQAGVTLKAILSLKPSYTGDVEMVYTVEGGGKKVVIEMTFNASGMLAVFRSGQSSACRYLRRVLPDVVYGNFTSGPNTPEFEEFTRAIDFDAYNSKTEFSLQELPETGKFDHNVKISALPSSIRTAFKLGEPLTVVDELHPTPHTYVFFYLDYPKPTLLVYWFDNSKPKDLSYCSVVYRPDGATTYDQDQGLLASREYSRVGHPVPYEILPTAS